MVTSRVTKVTGDVNQQLIGEIRRLMLPPLNACLIWGAYWG